MLLLHIAVGNRLIVSYYIATCHYHIDSVNSILQGGLGGGRWG